MIFDSSVVFFSLHLSCVFDSLVVIFTVQWKGFRWFCSDFLQTSLVVIFRESRVFFCC